MKKNFALTFVYFLISLFFSFNVCAATSILDVLRQQGFEVKALNDSEMSEIKGAAITVGITLPPPVQMTSGQTPPSVTSGLKVHMVTYKGWGSKKDYSSFNYIGNSYDTANNYSYTYQGMAYKIAGDKWMADFVDAPYSWQAKNAQLIEFQYQVLDKITLAPTKYTISYSTWNRPLAKFSW